MINDTNKYYIAIAVTLILSSCVTVPLNTEQNRIRLAESMGIEPKETVIMNYCVFEEVQEAESPKQLIGQRGIVAMTESEFCLMDGELRKAPKNYFFKIALSEIEAVSSSNGLIHVRSQNRLIVLHIYQWNNFVMDHDSTQKLYESLIFANVPGYETDQYYSFTRTKSPPKITPYNERKEPYDPYKFPDQ